MNFRYDIQGLRAVAVILVFLFHLNNTILPGGFVGVDVFFVISGYLISGIILNKKEKQTFNFFDFYISRFKRIVPVFYFFLIAVGVVGTFLYFNRDIQSLRMNMFWATVFNSNYYLSTLSNYFGAASTENPLLHTWTLSIEMQFYFLLPLLLLLLKRKYILPIISFLVIVFIGISYYNIAFLNFKQETYFSLYARIPEFLLGTILVLKEEQIKNIVNPFKEYVSIVSIVVLFICGFLFNEKSDFPGLLVLIPCLATCGLLICRESKLSLNILSSRFFNHLGELSYSIYLWHWAVMAFVRYYNYNYAFSIVESIIIVIVTYILSYLSYKFIEGYCRKLSNKKFLLFMMPVCLLLMFLIYSIPKINDKLSNIPELYSKPTFGLNSHGETFKNVEFLGDTKKANDSILLIGDSHALIYKGILDKIGKNEGFNFMTVSNNTYPTIPGIKAEDFGSTKLYYQYMNLMKYTNIELKRSKVIIISSIWAEKISSLPYAFNSFVSQLREDQKLIIIGDYPTLDKDPIRVNKGYVKDINQSNNYKVTLNDPPEFIERIAKKNDKKVFIIKPDYSDLMREAPFKNDTIMYYDSGHLNYFGATKIAEKLEFQMSNTLKKILTKNN